MKGWVGLVDLQRTVYPHKWSAVSCRSSVGQGRSHAKYRRSTTVLRSQCDFLLSSAHRFSVITENITRAYTFPPGLHFCCGQTVSANLQPLRRIDPQMPRFRWINAKSLPFNSSFHGHWRSLILVQKAVCDFLLLCNYVLFYCTVSEMADYWSNFSPRKRVPLFNVLQCRPGLWSRLLAHE